LPNISALCEFIHEVEKDDFIVSQLQISRAEDSLWKWIHSKPILTLSQDAVENVACSGCEENCYMPVEKVRTHENKIVYYVACDKRDDIGFVELTYKEVRPYKLNIMELCSLLATALESVDEEVQASIPNLLYKLGRCLIQGKGYTFFLALNVEDTGLITKHADYKNASNPVIISINNNILRDIALPMVLLDSLFIIGKDGLLSVFPDSIAALYQDDTIADKNIFRKDGDVWLASYNGKQSRIKHTKGCYYIKALLAAPNQEITCSQLQGLVDKTPPPISDDEDEYRGMSSDKLEAEGLAVHYESTDDLIDEETIKGYKATLKTIDAEIAEAESRGMTIKAAQLKNQKSFIEKELKKSTDIKGKSRKVPDASEKARKAVLASIKTAIKNIGNEMPALSLHLKSHISKGNTYKYTPEENLGWQI
jgi:hypothetical protein